MPFNFRSWFIFCPCAQVSEDTKRAVDSSSVCCVASKVAVKIGSKEEVFTVVGEWEADPASKKISHESPLGKALLGKSKGDNVEVDAPAGKVVYTVVSVK